MANRIRKYDLHCPVTEEEKQIIFAKMQQLGTNQIGAYIRKMAIDGYIINVDMAAIKEHTFQLQKIGNNVNQIAKRMNMGNVYQSDIDEIKELLKEIWRTQRYILSRPL